MIDFLRVCVVVPELKVADVEFNTEKIIEALIEAKKNNSEIVLFPELCISSYSCADLFYQTTLLNACLVSLNKIRKKTEELSIACIVGLPILINSKIYNTAAFISNGVIYGIQVKTYLPNTFEFYEERWFTSDFDRTFDSFYFEGQEIPFGADLIFHNRDYEFKIGIEICEDLWVIQPPSSFLAIAGANIIFNLSASPETLGKYSYRKELVKSQSAKTMTAYIYASAGSTESSSDVVFSGASMIYENGNLLSESQRFSFETEMIYSDIDYVKLKQERIQNSSYSRSKTEKIFREIYFPISIQNKNKILQTISDTPFIPKDLSKRKESISEIFSIQSTGLAKRLLHTKAKKVILGLSGGLDSTLALLVCIEAFLKLKLDLKGIIAISMPGLGTSSRTKNNAEKLANSLNVNFKTISIVKSVLQHFADIGQDENLQDITFENSQARERTQILMDIANKENGLVIGTGDMSELALGWCTFNGDQMSMYGVNSGVPKTLVRVIIEWCAEEKFAKEISDVLSDICDTPVSPELLPSRDDTITQLTEETVGPYILHDFFLYYMIRYSFAPRKIFFLATQAFDEKQFSKEMILRWMKVFYSRFFSQQFKRSSMPDGPKVGTVSLSPRGDLRMVSDAGSSLWLKEIDSIQID